MNTENKVTLSRTRAELVGKLNAPGLPPDKRMLIQGELSLVNAKIKALNTTEAARLKAKADRKRVAGIAEAQANTARARTNGGFQHHYRDDLACPACGTDSSVGCFANVAKAITNDRFTGAGTEDDDPGQTAAIDAWIDAVLLRNDVTFARTRAGKLSIHEAKFSPVIEMLIRGVYAAARGQELPDLPPTVPKADVKAPKTPRTKKT